jgi:hypothetical protein
VRRQAFAFVLLSACSKQPSALQKPPPARSAQPVLSTQPSAFGAAPAFLHRLQLTRATRAGQAALLDSGRADAWQAECRVHRACPRTQALPSCSEPLVALDSIAANELGGRPVILRGELSLGLGFETLVACSSKQHARPCCNGASRPAILTVSGTALELSGLGCGGDESRVCCNVPAFGQRVVASGYLGYAGDHEPQWRVRDASLCVEAAASER